MVLDIRHCKNFGCAGRRSGGPLHRIVFKACRVELPSKRWLLNGISGKCRPEETILKVNFIILSKCIMRTVLPEVQKADGGPFKGHPLIKIVSDKPRIGYFSMERFFYLPLMANFPQNPQNFVRMVRLLFGVRRPKALKCVQSFDRYWW